MASVRLNNIANVTGNYDSIPTTFRFRTVT